MHCPQCGKPMSEQAAACEHCGSALDASRGGSGALRAMARTMVGVIDPGSRPEAQPLSGAPSQVLKTKVGFQPLPHQGAARSEEPLRAREPGGDATRGPNAHEPAGELGATLVTPHPAARASAKRLKAHAMQIPRPVPPSLKRKAARANAEAKRARVQGNERSSTSATSGSRVVIALVAGAVALAAAGVLVAVLWHAREPVQARPATDAQGRETLELSCSSCPDGTTLTIGKATATVMGGAAVLALSEPLAAGDNPFNVRIDRPGRGRDEAASLFVHLPYRIRPELGTLQGDRPAIQVVVEAAAETRVALDGRPVPLIGGRAVETFDVIDACTGLTSATKSLSRQIPYVVTPKGGEPERGSVSVTVGIVPLELDAPGPNVVIDGPSFVLAGRTLKGAELLAAGKPVPVKADGSFAHVMNVSSIGATQIEVRAKLAGMAPRLSRIKVRRVDSLETAAREFAAESPITYAALARDVARHAGRAIVVAGHVLDVKRENHRTTMILDVGPSAGCKACTARLVQGAENPVQPGEPITAYGHVKLGTPASNGASVPEIEVDFTVKGLR